ncbi:MAG: hypothetical protein NTZ55_01695, partial [Candidatus Roizmanbacteria bacterium]|nr:hypothetical protein [Candidatus Roizmanbacteria bacterium]
ITATDRKKIYNILAEAYLDLVEKGLIGKFERKVISKKVLDNVGSAHTFEEVSAFIRSLLKFYPVFHNAQVQVDSEIGKLHEEDVMGRLQQFIRASK